MANPVLGKFLRSDWFFLGQDFAVRTVSMETVQPVYFCFGAKPGSSKFATKTAKKNCEYRHCIIYIFLLLFDKPCFFSIALKKKKASHQILYQHPVLLFCNIWSLLTYLDFHYFASSGQPPLPPMSYHLNFALVCSNFNSGRSSQDGLQIILSLGMIPSKFSFLYSLRGFFWQVFPVFVLLQSFQIFKSCLFWIGSHSMNSNCCVTY